MQPFFSITIYGAITIGLFVLSFFASRAVRDFGIRQGIYAIVPSASSGQAPSGGKVALWGGLAFVPALAVYAPIFLGLPAGKAIIFSLAILAFVLFGLLDDLIGFSPLPQVFMQSVASFALLFVFGMGAWQLALVTFAFFAASMNAMNWLDGLDGLAGITFIAALLPIAGLLFFRGDYTSAWLIAAFLASLGGFLLLNISPAKLYMGTAGSMGLGLFAGIIVAVYPNLLPVLLCSLVLPLGDAVAVSLQRMLARTAPWQGGDRRHLHYRLLDAGVSLRAILLLYAGATLLFSLAGIAMNLAQAATALFLAPVSLVVVISFCMRPIFAQESAPRAQTLA